MDFGGHHVGWAEETAARKAARAGELELSEESAEIDLTEEKELPHALTENEGVALEVFPVQMIESASLFSLEQQEEFVQLFGKDWHVEDRLGRGAFGEVFRVRQTPRAGWERAMIGPRGRVAAMKYLYEPSRKEIEKHYKEVASLPSGAELRTDIEQIGDRKRHLEQEIAASIKIGALQDLRRVEDAHGERALGMLLAFLPGEDMQASLDAFDFYNTADRAHTERAIGAVAMESVVQHIQSLHRLGWSHGDIKPNNIRMDQELPHLARAVDFGLAEHIDVPRRKDDFSGTPRYAAPEIYAGGMQQKSLEDLYSLGMCLARWLRLVSLDRIKIQRPLLVQIEEQIHGTFYKTATSRESIQTFITQQTGQPLSPAELRLAELTWDIVLPHANAEKGERVAAWQKYADGLGMDMHVLSETLSDILDELFEEREYDFVRQKEVLALAEEGETQTKQEAQRLVDAVDKQFALYNGDAEAERGYQIALLKKECAAIRTREDAEIVCILAQDVLATIGGPPLLEPVELEGAERQEIDMLIEEARQRQLVERPLTESEWTELQDLLGKRQPSQSSEEGNKGDQQHLAA
ncbi:TPA: hypothetical protein DEB00_00545 [Candidatus Uhrbacteria bacterium]|nr:hypothetical protein [Candidatus Uhrbacteria bacterium]